MARLSIVFMAALLMMTAGVRPGKHDESGALSVHGDGSEGTKAIGGRTNMKINFLLTRHALSCANAVKYFPSTAAYSVYHVRVQDPLLTECGAYRSRGLREGLRSELEQKKLTPDYVLSSHLLRAMETAIFMYGVEDGRQVTPVPYVSESGMGYDNTKFNTEKQNNTLLEKYGKVAINWEWMKQPAYANTAPDWGQFLQFMGKRFLPEVVGPSEGQNEPRPAEELTIAVVTHNGLMKSIVEWVDTEIAAERAKKLTTEKKVGAEKEPGLCTAEFFRNEEEKKADMKNNRNEEKKKADMKNNQVFRVTFDYMKETRTLSLQQGPHLQQGPQCELLLDKKIMGRPTALCERDTQCANDAWIKTEASTDKCCT